MKKVEQIISLCDDCPHCKYSLLKRGDVCDKSNKLLARANDGFMAIPDDCPLEDAE